MAISEFSAGPTRKRIGFVRYPPASEAQIAFSQRGYDCYLLDDPALKKPGTIAVTSSVIISQLPGKPSRLKADIKRFRDVLNYDCRLYVRHLPDPDSLALVLDTLSKEGLPPSGANKNELSRFSWQGLDPHAAVLGPFAHVLAVDALRPAEEWDRLANLIAGNPAGAPPNIDLAIDPRTAGDVGARATDERALLRLTDERELLLKRAFWDCSSIDLFPRTEGMSGVNAFEAFAHFDKNVVGGVAPYRCFIKLGPRDKVAREYENYRTTALENVPFHLGPRLRADRCALGRSQGLITCDYVVGAETLRDCIRDGRGVHVIGNLFNQTLISWRRAASEEPRPLQEFLTEHLRERSVIPAHREPSMKEHGATKSLEDLKAIIAKTRPSQPVLVGVIHGDLHATNVLVRMNDAVIIDLERVAKSQPLLLDAASLESGLFIDGFVGDRRSVEEVLDSLQPLYSTKALGQDDHYCNPSNKSAWYVDSVRQIRMQARQMERQPQQYGWTLAAVLLKKACNPEILQDIAGPEAIGPQKLTREVVRAMAFVLAEKIILRLFEEHEKNST